MNVTNLKANMEWIVTGILLVLISCIVVFFTIRYDGGAAIISHEELRIWCTHTEKLNPGFKCAPVPYEDFEQ